MRPPRAAQEVAALAELARFDYLVIESTGARTRHRHHACASSCSRTSRARSGALPQAPRPRGRLAGVSEPMPVAAAFFAPDAAGRSLADVAAIDAMARPAGHAAPAPHASHSASAAGRARHRPRACSVARRQGSWGSGAPWTGAAGAQVTVVDATSFEWDAGGGGSLCDRALGAGPGDARSVAGLLADQARPRARAPAGIGLRMGLGGGGMLRGWHWPACGTRARGRRAPSQGSLGQRPALGSARLLGADWQGVSLPCGVRAWPRRRPPRPWRRAGRKVTAVQAAVHARATAPGAPAALRRVPAAPALRRQSARATGRVCGRAGAEQVRGGGRSACGPRGGRAGRA